MFVLHPVFFEFVHTATRLFSFSLCSTVRPQNHFEIQHVRCGRSAGIQITVFSFHCFRNDACSNDNWICGRQTGNFYLYVIFFRWMSTALCLADSTNSSASVQISLYSVRYIQIARAMQTRCGFSNTFKRQ